MYDGVLRLPMPAKVHVTRNRAGKGYRQETLNAEEMSRYLADMHCFTEVDANINADGIAAI